MKPTTSQPACGRCGNCCDRPGFVYLKTEEVERIAEHLGLTVGDFTARYTRLSDNRRQLSLMDSPSGGCALLDDRRQCRIQPVKPRQCADFPWRWSYDGYEKFCVIGRFEAQRARENARPNAGANTLNGGPLNHA